MRLLKALVKDFRGVMKLFYNDYKAWKRGHQRVVPRFGVNGVITRGRTHEPKTKPPSGNEAKVKPLLTVQAIHRRADGTLVGEHYTSKELE